MIELKIQPVASQKINVVLDGQNCEIGLDQKNQGLFMSVAIDGRGIVNSVICRDATRLTNSASGFRGDLVFTDLAGKTDPVHTGLGDRYRLLYLTAAENAIL